MLAILAPGQGAQTPGFLAPWLELPGFAERMGAFGEVTGIDLAAHGTSSDAEAIRDTAIAQPLLVAAGLAGLAELLDGTELDGDVVVAGHSVGEFTAAAAAGVVDEKTAMTLVRERGAAMAAASAIQPTSMTAVIGGDREQVLAAIDEAGLTPANNNGSGQIVAAGTIDQLAEFAENPPARTRLFPLSVAGAFHTVHMQSAVAHLREVAADAEVHAPHAILLSNRDGLVVDSGSDCLDRLVEQVANPVRWDLCMDTMRELGVTGILELLPAGTLTGIAKRNLKGVALFNLNTPDQLDEARAFVAEHRAQTAAN